MAAQTILDQLRIGLMYKYNTGSLAWEPWDGTGAGGGGGTVTQGPAGASPWLVTATSWPLPTGAATAAKQPALGTAGAASADVITIQGIASMTPLAVVPSSVALPANQSVNAAQINGVTPLMGAGNTGTGSPRVTIATDQAVIPATLKPATTGGTTPHQKVAAASTNATNVKASAGQLFGWYIYNSNAAARKVMFHNTAGTPTAGASTFFPLVIPPGAAANVMLDIGIAFGTGIAYTMVTGLADNDSTGVAANDLVMTLFYN